MKILVTGAAGFIGFHLAQKLLKNGHKVIGLDNLNTYYDVSLKEKRISLLKHHQGFLFYEIDVAEQHKVTELFQQHKFDQVVHLAAQAGVRYSVTNPHVYISSNIVGFLNILEGCRHSKVSHLVYASSSSVYGANTNMPFSVHQNVDHPVSLYAASKKSNELMAHSYSHLYDLPTTGLRFFTVYGPWGRPDMAIFRFTKAILEGKPIDVYNYGEMKRDFTFIDDIVEGIVRITMKIAEPDTEWSGLQPTPGTSKAAYRIYNIGNHKPINLLRFIDVLENALGKEAIKNMLPIQPGDVQETYADIEDLSRSVGYTPLTEIEEGIPKFVEWYRNFYQV
jgi:UDP-glucuronate 4-epimerase